MLIDPSSFVQPMYLFIVYTEYNDLNTKDKQWPSEVKTAITHVTHTLQSLLVLNARQITKELKLLISMTGAPNATLTIKIFITLKKKCGLIFQLQEFCDCKDYQS